MPRRREYIPYEQRLAAALACLLPAELRDRLRRDRIPASEVIKLFTYDHIALHALNGSDLWHNLDPRQRGPDLDRKDAIDTGIAARVKRLAAQHDDFRRRVLAVRKVKRKVTSRWPKRKLRNVKRR
jgi:hypothetical protein